MRRTLALVIAAAAAGGLAGGLIGYALDNRGSGSTPSASAASDPATAPAVPVVPAAERETTRPSSEQIYRRDSPAVVVITDTQTEVVPSTFFTPEQKEQVGALGSGFVIDRRGDVVTNDHVVQGAKNIRVGFSGGASYPATIVGTDPATDVAVVRVKAPARALRPLAFADSSGVLPGDPVYAIGNPFGLDRTMTAGIVSAVGRDIQAPDGLTIPNAIQTDAPINHGNSGGPLLDRFGRVIGITAQIQGGTVNANVGVGFAIPSATARSVVTQLIAKGHAEHAWLGIEIEPIDASVAKVVRGLPDHGVVVARVVKGSPAAAAGLKAATRHVTVNGVGASVGGDTIVAVDGKPVVSAAQLGDAVALHEPGDKLKLQVVRNGVTRTVTVTLGNVPGVP
jgi:putative serine protease PepD